MRCTALPIAGARVVEQALLLLAAAVSVPAAFHSVGFVLIRAAEFSVKSAQAPRPYRQALKTFWRGSDRVGCCAGPADLVKSSLNIVASGSWCL